MSLTECAAWGRGSTGWRGPCPSWVCPGAPAPDGGSRSGWGRCWPPGDCPASAACSERAAQRRRQGGRSGWGFPATQPASNIANWRRHRSGWNQWRCLQVCWKYFCQCFDGRIYYEHYILSTFLKVDNEAGTSVRRLLLSSLKISKYQSFKWTNKNKMVKDQRLRINSIFNLSNEAVWTCQKS